MFSTAYLELSEAANVSCQQYTSFPRYRSHNLTSQYVDQIRRRDKNFHENEADHPVSVGYIE